MFQQENGNTFTLLIIFIVKSLKIAQISYYDPQSARINPLSPQSDSTPLTLTLSVPLSTGNLCEKQMKQAKVS